MSQGDRGAARAYHHRTKHSEASIRSKRHRLDWENQPSPFKMYRRLGLLPLPATLPPIESPALEAIATIEAPRTGRCVPDLTTLAQLLHYSGGITRRRTYPGGEICFRAAPCTGALYHIDLYVVCGDIEGLDAGVYHFGPHEHGLRCLRQGDYRDVLTRATGNESATAVAPVILVCTSTYWRNAWKYQERTYRHCFWDCGTVLAHVLALAAARALPARVVAGFADHMVADLLGLESPREGALVLVPLGHTEGEPLSPVRHRDLEPLTVETVPLSRREVDYPAIREMHAASSLPTPEAVVAWRSVRGPLTGTRVLSAHCCRLEPAGDDTCARSALDRVITRRGSPRRFGRAALSLQEFSTVLDRATRGVPADYLSAPGALFNEFYIIVNSVDGLQPGSYVFHRDQASLELLQEGDFRRVAGHLGLGQALAADASADVFLLAQLDPILQRYGDRGYRIAQLEAGILGGKLYLGAYAQHLGATGLTFFDDDVTEFFSPHAGGKDVMFLVALGVSERRVHLRR